MNAFPFEECCVCGDPDCVGCDCGMECAYSPGHDRGTNAITPLAAMIEATERFLVEDLAQGKDGRSVLSRLPGEIKPSCGAREVVKSIYALAPYQPLTYDAH